MSRSRRLAFIACGGSIAAALAAIWLVSSMFWCQIPVRAGSHLYCMDFSVGCIWVSDYEIWGQSPNLNDARAGFFAGPILGRGKTGWKALPAFEYTGPVNTAPPGGSRLNIRWQLILPLYPFFLVLGVPALLMLRAERKRRKHARLGTCRECGYDLTGISGPCPECGPAIPRST